MRNNIILELYQDSRTVFSFQEIAMLADETDFGKLKQRINYHVKTNKLRNLRRGIYAKSNYSPEELACKIYSPSYLSLDYVLQKTGIIFQYSNTLTIISYLRRSIKVAGHDIHSRKIKNEILYNNAGIEMQNNGCNIATPERAFLDTLYLNKEYYFDALNLLNKDLVSKLLTIYQSEQLTKKVHKLLNNV